MSDDVRAGAYHELHREMAQTEMQNRHSARRILPLLQKYIDIQSVLDVGCGLGAWLYVAREMHIHDVKGVEGPWLDKANAVIDPSLIDIIDLEQGFSLSRQFDLALCLEVGEHLPASAAANLVQSLCNHSRAILFSAALPFQGGHYHVNEQLLPYWIELFAARQFQFVDLVRHEIWDDAMIFTWLRQNVVLFAHAELIAASPALAAEAKIKRPISIVHPEIFLDRMKKAREMMEDHNQLVSLMRQAGTFQAQVRPDNGVEIHRV